MADRLNPTALPNVSNELIASFAMEADLAQRDIDEAASRKRAVLKRASRAGVRTKTLLAALALRKGDPDEALAELRDLLRYTTVLAPGINFSQTSLFDALDTRPLNEAVQAELLIWDADREGWDCGLAGGSPDDATYAPGSPAANAFIVGFHRGERAAAEKLGENAKQADASRTKPRRGKPEHDVDLNDAVEAGNA